MKRKLFVNSFTVVIIILTATLLACQNDRNKAEAEVSAHELFKSKCTTCHGENEAYKIHGTEETILKVIQRMTEKGAKLSKIEATNIAGFLGSPHRSLFEAQCVKCHTMDNVLTAHKKKALTQATLEEMQKKGADISAQDKKNILDYLNKFFVPAK